MLSKAVHLKNVMLTRPVGPDLIDLQCWRATGRFSTGTQDVIVAVDIPVVDNGLITINEIVARLEVELQKTGGVPC